MGVLATSMSTALGALNAEKGALQVTGNNIANVNTPGYSRERADLVEQQSEVYGNLVVGDGVSLDKVESLRDNVLELRLNDQAQQQGGDDAFVNAMQQVQTLFSDPSSGVGAEITAFFNSINQLQIDPTSSASRQGVLTAAGNVANSFNTTAQNLTLIQQNLDLSVVQSVNQINQLTQQIAQLNGQVAALQKLGSDGGTLEDQETQLIRQLSGLINVSAITTPDGLSLTTSSGAALVVGSQSFNLTTSPDPATGLNHVFSQGSDITAGVTGGTLGGTLAVRDQNIPSIMTSLDDLAYNLATNLNAANQAGYALDGSRGGDLFAPLASQAGAASEIQLTMTDPNGIAASGDGSAGSDSNLANFTAVQTAKIVSGQSPPDAYSNLVFTVGADLSNAQSNQQANNLMTQQLQNERDALSGVSLDEESANLVSYQRAFEAAARMVSVVDNLTVVSLNLGLDTAVS
jgi:flagellar hook-associated protein 1